MKRILLLLLINLCCSCKSEPSNIENKPPQQDNGWFLYQQKIHSLIPLESYDIACRITLAPAENHLPASVITTWESGENNFIKITSIKGFRGRFESAGTYALRREFNLREIMNCFYSNEKTYGTHHFSQVVVEETFNGSYSRHIYDFEDNKACVIDQCVRQF